MIRPLITLHAASLSKVSSFLVFLVRKAEGCHVVPSSLVILSEHFIVRSPLLVGSSYLLLK